MTAVPELRRRCHAFPDGTDLTLRLEELLGLPPHDGKTRLVQLWADPHTMFRPTPDPEVNDSEADLDFPESSRSSVSEEHRLWFNNLRATSYGPKGYPWTRLGYTYDWGSPASHVGLSGFVIDKGAPVTVESVIAAPADYCQRAGAGP